MATNETPDYLADLWDLGLDLARANSGVDVERAADTRNVPDNVDLKTGQLRANTPTAGTMATGGFNWKTAVIVVVSLAIGGVLLRRVVK